MPVAILSPEAALGRSGESQLSEGTRRHPSENLHMNSRSFDAFDLISRLYLIIVVFMSYDESRIIGTL